MKMKCQHCGREYIVFNSTAIVKGAFCCLACELAWEQSRKGYPGYIRNMESHKRCDSYSPT